MVRKVMLFLLSYPALILKIVIGASLIGGLTYGGIYFYKNKKEKEHREENFDIRRTIPDKEAVKIKKLVK